jgi:formiminotetrahydrofolate cyclodeaminase
LKHESIGGWLDELGSAAPAPGGGAAAALELALGAALVEMVCNLTIGRPAYAEHEPTLLAARERAVVLRAEALILVDEDAEAFRDVIEAYKLPRASEAEIGLRTARIQAALVGAADVPRRTARAAAEVVELGASILAGANPNVISDIAAGAAAARAALASALVNIEVNRVSITEPALKASLAEALEQIEAQIVAADELVAEVRRRMVG